jgi:hypothetical protein
MDAPCELGRKIEKNIYSKSMAISATRTNYNPRIIKLFCWSK